MKIPSGQAEFSPNMALSTFAEKPLISENPKWGGRFYRRWKYYLLYCAGSFRARHVQLWQIVFSKRVFLVAMGRFGEGGLFLLAMRKNDQGKIEICRLLTPPTNSHLAASLRINEYRLKWSINV